MCAVVVPTPWLALDGSGVPKRLRYRLMLGVALACLVGAGLVVRLVAEEGDDGEAAPPRVTAAPARSVLPDDYPTDDVEMFGRALSTWDDDAGRVIQYRGDFRLDFAKRRISANDAVIWIAAEQVDGKQLKKFTVYLDGHVRVSEVGGTTLTAGRQIVTFETVGRIWTDANVRGEPAGESDFYKRAVTFRNRAAASTQPAIEPEAPVTQPAVPEPVAPPPPVRYTADRTSMMVRGEERMVLADGHVYISRAEPAGRGKLFMEIQSDRAVVFLRESKVQETMSRSPASRPDMADVVIGAYLEGAVVLRQGPRTIEASRLYYDFEHERALILDAILFEPHPRGVPMIVWADQLRQLSGTQFGRSKDDADQPPKQAEFVARNARITTSEMNTPQYSLHAQTMYLKATEIDADGHNELYYRTRGETFELRDHPVFWWPGSQGTVDQQATAIRTVRGGLSSNQGAFIDVEWDLFKLLNRPKIAGVDATLDTAYYAKRGPSVIAKTEYTKEDYFGYMLAHGVADQGWDPFSETENMPITGAEDEADSGKDKQKSFKPRGRYLWRHHQYLKNNWELIAELSFLSDRDFLKDWYQGEFDTGKEQETLVYLKKAWDNNAFSILMKPRINAFLNQAEKLPEIKYYKLGEPLWSDRLVYFSENSAGIVNYAVDDERLDRQGTGALGRIDTRHEWQLPLRRGPMKIVPYFTLRLTHWTKGSDGMVTEYVPPDDQFTASIQPTEENTGSGGMRPFAAFGVKNSMIFSRVYNDVESRFWDVHRLRHIIEPVFNVHLAGSSLDRNELPPIDPGVEGINGSTAMNLGVHQRLQTKRGGPGAWRNVDWMRLDLDLVAFANDPTNTFFENEFTRANRTEKLKLDNVFARGEWFDYRPENSLALTTFNWYYEWRASDSTTLMFDGNLGEGGLSRANFGASLQRTPRWRTYFGNRYLAVTNSNDLIFQSHYKINRKYDMLFGYAFDTLRGEMASTQFTLVRKCQRFYVAVTFDVSNIAQQNKDSGGAGAQSIMVTIWPEGAHEVTLGDPNISRPGTTSSSVQLP